MLARLEKMYLGLLRVAILILASIALIVSILGLVSATPELLRRAGLSQAEKVKGATLAEFIAEQKADNPDAITDAGTSDTVSPSPVLPAIKDAAANIGKYPGLTVDRDALAKALQQNADNSQGHNLEYADSIKALTDELAHSTGKPLSSQRIGALIDWHHSRFMADAAAKDAEKVTATTKMMAELGVAASAFVAFILMIFLFIFVKIERNLRVLQAIAPEAVERG